MQTMPFQDEVFEALRGLLLADEELLETVPAGNIWQGNDVDGTRWPSVIFRGVSDGPVLQMSGPGLWRPTLRLGVHGYRIPEAGKMTAAQIAARVATLWTIGAQGSVTETVLTTNFRIDGCQLQDQAFIDGITAREDGGRAVVTCFQLWRVRIAQRTQSNG